MKTRRRWISAVLGLVCIAVMALSGVAIHHRITHASGGSMCFDGTSSLPSCAGLDPRDQGCNADATDAHTEDINRGTYTVTLAVRYSHACNAWWVRAIAFPASAVTSVTVYNLAAPSSSDTMKTNFWQSQTVIDGTMQAYTNMSSTLPATGLLTGEQAEAFAIVGVAIQGLSQSTAGEGIYFDR